MNQSQSEQTISGPGRHLPALDGVRGLTILMVMVVHLMIFNGYTGNFWINSLNQMRSLCWMGVDLFFVLSGFLITGILYDTLHDERYFRNFYMRRFLRIFPLYYGFLLLLLILTPVLHAAWAGRQFVLLAYLQNTSIWFRVGDFHPGRLIDLNHFWSLAVEEQFYFFWPLLVFLVKDRKRLMQLTLWLSVIALALRVGLYLQDNRVLSLGVLRAQTFCRMDTLMLGGFLALWLRGEAQPENRDKICRKFSGLFFWAVMPSMVLIAVAHPQIRTGEIPFIATFGYTLIALAFACLIYLAIQPNSGWNKFFCMGWLRSLGKYSYGIYVLHILVGYVWGMALRALLGTSLRIWLTPRLHSRSLAVLIEFFLTVGVVYCAAWCSYNFYEVHFLRLKRYFRNTSQNGKLSTEPSQEIAG